MLTWRGVLVNSKSLGWHGYAVQLSTERLISLGLSWRAWPNWTPCISIMATIPRAQLSGSNFNSKSNIILLVWKKTKVRDHYTFSSYISSTYTLNTLFCVCRLGSCAAVRIITTFFCWSSTPSTGRKTPKASSSCISGSMGSQSSNHSVRSARIW